nr:MAG: RNA-dependent RNA polymerase [Botourmiaviridae sp.]
MTSFDHEHGEAPCPAGGSTRQALNRAARLLEQEYFPLGCPTLQRRFRGPNCFVLWAELQERKLLLLSAVTEERSRRSLQQALKSLGRLFDASCKPCDKKSFLAAKESWVRKVSTPYEPPPASWSSDPIGELVRVVAKLLGPDWAKGMEWRKEVLCDQRGCYEYSREVGGTLAVPLVLPSGSRPRYGMRVECAKTKGKVRVVTCQTAAVKRRLRSAHEHLYDFLSRRGWLVRGDFTARHAEWLAEDLRPGEQVISADFSDATGNLSPEVSWRVAQLVASAPSLPPGVRDDILGSFEPGSLHASCRVGKKTLYSGPVLRGQMQGNFFSFPILCLINKASHTIARRICRSGYRRVLINGDDTSFVGTEAFFRVWVDVVTTWGMVVNEEKTGISPSFVELNSRSYHLPTKTFVKKPVLSFLRPGPDPSCVLTQILQGLGGCKQSTVMMAISFMRNSIVASGVCLTSVPEVLHKNLLKRRFYRQALVSDRNYVVEGPERALRVVTKEVRPRDDWMRVYDTAVECETSFLKSRFEGVSFPQFKRRLVSTTSPLVLSRTRFHVQRPRWTWRWPGCLWSAWETMGLPTSSMSGPQWAHPHLSRRRVLLASSRIPPPLSLLVDCVRPDGVGFV